MHGKITYKEAWFKRDVSTDQRTSFNGPIIPRKRRTNGLREKGEERLTARWNGVFA